MFGANLSIGNPTQKRAGGGGSPPADGLTLNAADVLGVAVGYYPDPPGPFGSVSGALMDGITLQKAFYYIDGAGLNIAFEPSILEVINRDLHLEIDGTSYPIPENRIVIAEDVTINPLDGTSALVADTTYLCRLLGTVQTGPFVVTPALASSLSFTGFLRGPEGFGAGSTTGANLLPEHPVISAFHDPTGDRFSIMFYGEDAGTGLSAKALRLNGADPLNFADATVTASGGTTQYQWGTISNTPNWEWADAVGVPQTLTIV